MDNQINQYREPGEGAITFALEYTKGLTKQEAEPIIASLLKGELHEVSDKRVKRCDYCGYWWRDESVRNTKKTCSKECKTGIKTLQRSQQRERKALLNPPSKKKKRRRADDYVWWLEYPYWLDEDSMLRVTERFEVLSEEAFIDHVASNGAIYGIGNRKKTNRQGEF
ncbi:hypothetical protein [Halalkalibacter oceani]|uniref:hypothetical protein n=1 Tax=Halalkalibacter oceani TaxID=1653776 RepID=UPI0035F301B4